jgi:hypothetical protein
MAHIYDFKIGSTFAGLAYLEELTVPVMVPNYLFRAYSQALDLGDGTLRGGGWASVDWIWNANSNDYILTAQRDQLRTFCPGASAEVYIQTYTNEQDTITPFGSNVAKTFACVMIWPQEERRDAKVRRDFVIKFRRLIEATS